MNTEESITKYNDNVRMKFLDLGICTTANIENTKVVDCYYNKEYPLLDKKDTMKITIDYELGNQFEHSICDEVLEIKDENIKVLLIRICPPYGDANELHKMDTVHKEYIETNRSHPIKVFLFDNIDSGFYSLI